MFPSNDLEETERFTEPYRRLNKRMDRSLLHNEVEFVNKSLERLVQKSKLLDICCGIGEVSLMLRTQGFLTFGLDKNQLALTIFQQNSHEVPLIQGDALNLPFCEESFDVIVALHCFDLIDQVIFLQECSRLLHRGGVLIFDALNRQSYKLMLKRLGRFLGPRLTHRENNKWIDVLSCREILKLIRLSGFDLQAASGYGWSPFSVYSNSSLVEAAAMAERVLQLDLLPFISPRIIIAAQKI